MDKGKCTQSAFCQHRVHQSRDGNAEISAFTECLVARGIVQIFFFFEIIKFMFLFLLVDFYQSKVT